MNKAQEIITKLGLKKHPEGGYYHQTFRDEKQDNERAISSAIYYLLEKNDKSHWHRIDAVEIWHFYAGSPLKLSISDGKQVEEHILGSDIFSNESPQIIVPCHQWQSAISLGEWTLVGCTVAPGFEFSNFEIAPFDWSPNNN